MIILQQNFPRIVHKGERKLALYKLHCYLLIHHNQGLPSSKPSNYHVHSIHYKYIYRSEQEQAHLCMYINSHQAQKEDTGFANDGTIKEDTVVINVVLNYGYVDEISHSNFNRCIRAEKDQLQVFLPWIHIDN